MKIVLIEYCQQCPKFLETSNFWCGESKRTIRINPEEEIPAWCRLPDAPLPDESSNPEPAGGYKGSIKHPQRIVEWDNTGAKTSRR